MNEFIEGLDDIQKVIIAVLATGLIHLLIASFCSLISDLVRIVAHLIKIFIRAAKAVYTFIRNKKRSKINLRRYE